MKVKSVPALPQGEAEALYLQAYNLSATLLTSILPQDQVSKPWQTRRQKGKNLS